MFLLMSVALFLLEHIGWLSFIFDFIFDCSLYPSRGCYILAF
jgi:hypothetical protein